MTVLKSGISWCTGTWSPTVGCTKVSAGCDNCYAEKLVNRLMGGKGAFDTVVIHEKRLRDVDKFKPQRSAAGKWTPYLCFVNSLSDLFHQDIPRTFLDKVFDAIDSHPDVVFQILTKRPMSMREYIVGRYKGGRVGAHIWLGVSVEDNRVRGRVDAIRRLKDAVGPFTAFLSVEPLIGPVDRVEFHGIEWVILGGESGPGARSCDVEWLRIGRDKAKAGGASVYFKQFGTMLSNPLVTSRMAKHPGMKAKEAFDEVCTIGLEKAPEEKGGATLDTKLWREFPQSFHDIAHRLQTRSLI